MHEDALQLDGSPELAALVLRLHRWFADVPFSSGEIAAVVLTVARPSSDKVPIEAYLRNYVAALERCGYIEKAGDAWRLKGRALDFAKRQDRAIEHEIDLLGLNLDALPAAPEPSQRAPAEADLHQVTRTFLEDMLSEALMPAEMIETIMGTYERRGRLTMSEDGGAYRIQFSKSNNSG